jgi:hypothetical protein
MGRSVASYRAIATTTNHAASGCWALHGDSRTIGPACAHAGLRNVREQCLGRAGPTACSISITLIPHTQRLPLSPSPATGMWHSNTPYRPFALCPPHVLTHSMHVLWPLPVCLGRRMVAGGEVSAVISQREGLVTFTQDPHTWDDPASARRLEGALADSMALAERLQVGVGEGSGGGVAGVCLYLYLHLCICRIVWRCRCTCMLPQVDLLTVCLGLTPSICATCSPPPPPPQQKKKTSNLQSLSEALAVDRNYLSKVGRERGGGGGGGGGYGGGSQGAGPSGLGGLGGVGAMLGDDGPAGMVFG